MKKKKYAVLLIVVVLICVVSSVVFAAPDCPNCGSPNTETLADTDILVGYSDYCYIDSVVCDWYETYKIYHNYGCNNCQYNWGVFWKYEEVHDCPSHN